MAKNEVATKPTELATMDTRPDFLKNAARGNEEVTNNEITLPRIEIIQDLSPQRKKSEPEYIDGADSGMAFNTLTKELFDGDILFIPVYFSLEYLLWKDRKKGGGFGGSFPTMSEAERARQQLPDSGDYELIDTHVHYVLIVKAGSTPENPILEEAVISMSKSKAKVSRQLNTLIKLAGGDRFSKIYRLSVIEDKSNNGDAFYNWKVAARGYVSEPMYRFAEGMYEAIKGGQRAVSHEDEGQQATTNTASSTMDVDPEENPFN